MSKTTIDLKDLDDLLCKYKVENLEDLENRLKNVVDLESKLAESEKELNRYAELFGMKDKDFYVVEKTEYEKMKQGAKDIVMQLKQQLANYERIYTSLGFDNSKQFEDYVQFTMMNSDDKIKELRELQAKLAKSEKDRLMWQEMYKSADKQNKEICETDIYPLQEQVQQLKQQLAEKEKEIDNLYNRLNSKQKFYEMGLAKDYKEYLSRLNKIKKEHNQDKISFCIEKLEKVKNEITPIFCVPNGIYSNLHNEVFKTIDNQIKLLKEGKSQ